MHTKIVNAKIRTMDAANPIASAAVIHDDLFDYVGNADVAEKYLDGIPHETIDAGGADVLPGFNDSHMHVLHCAGVSDVVSLQDAESVEACIELMKSAYGKRVDGWIVAEGWNQEHFREKRMFTRADLDAVSEDIPVVARRVCGHLVVANTYALRLAGLINHDGVLRENECGAIYSLMPEPSVAEQLERLIRFQPKLFEHGITSVQSDDLGWIPEGEAKVFLRAMAEASDNGRLMLRYAAQVCLDGYEETRRFFNRRLHEIRGQGFRVAHQKLFADGSLGARTAWLSTPYADSPDTSGIQMMSTNDMALQIRLAAEYGVPSTIHVIGDAAFGQALDAIELGGLGLRHALVHAQITQWPQIWRCGRMGLDILAQPAFLRTDMPIIEKRVGALADSSYRWKSLLGAGSTVAFGTDSPVEPFDPMLNLYCAIARHGPNMGHAYLPEEAFALDEALYAYTVVGARVSGESQEKGRIAAGMLADFVVLDGNLSDDDPESLLTVGIRETYIGGTRVFAKGLH